MVEFRCIPILMTCGVASMSGEFGILHRQSVNKAWTYMSWPFPLGDSRVPGHIRYHPDTTSSAQLSNPDLVKSLLYSHRHLANHHESHSCSHVMLDGHPFFHVNISADHNVAPSLPISSDWDALENGFEGNEAFQSHLFSLYISSSSSWTRCWAILLQKFYIRHDRNLSTYFFPILCHRRPHV